MRQPHPEHSALSQRPLAIGALHGNRSAHRATDRPLRLRQRIKHDAEADRQHLHSVILSADEIPQRQNPREQAQLFDHWLFLRRSRHDDRHERAAARPIPRLHQPKADCHPRHLRRLLLPEQHGRAHRLRPPRAAACLRGRSGTLSAARPRRGPISRQLRLQPRIGGALSSDPLRHALSLLHIHHLLGTVLELKTFQPQPPLKKGRRTTAAVEGFRRT